MFHEINCFEDVIRSIALERTLFQFVEGYQGDFLDGEMFYQEALEITYSIAQEVIYLDYTDSHLYFFRFDEMDEFYELCKEHSRRYRVKFKKDPYVKDAENNVFGIMGCSGVENAAVNYWVPPELKKKRQHRFVIELGCYFYEWMDMIQAVCEIREYFRKKVAELKAELYPAPKVLVLPTPVAATTEERKAA